MDPSTEPQTLTVEEAAKVLRIGRTAAYALAREWRATSGRSGLPVLELGRTLRVPRHALEQMLTGLPRASESEAPRREATVAPATGAIGQSQLWDDGSSGPS
jgi:excisionase family DNA binding protein